MKISDMSRDEKRDYLESAYDAACDAHEAGELEGGHPSHTVVGWSKLGQGRDGLPGNVGLAKPIEDDPLADSADPLTEADPSTPGGNRARGRTAQDGAFALGTDGVPRFTLPDGRVIAGDAALAARVQSSRSTSASVASMNKIPGYSRLK